MLLKSFKHLPLFHIIGASRVIRVNLLSTFRCHGGSAAPAPSLSELYFDIIKCFMKTIYNRFTKTCLSVIVHCLSGFRTMNDK